MTRSLVTGLLLAVALALPGVARAADGDSTPAAQEGAPAPQQAAPVATDEATCRVKPDLGVDRAEQMARLQARLLEEQARTGGDVVVLNGRGYRYDNAPEIARDLRVLEIELARARAAAKATPKP